MKTPAKPRFLNKTVNALRIAIGATSLLPSLCAQEAGGDTPERPNILWLVTEDNSPYTIGAYGDPLARTPVIDGLASRGIVYEHAYAAAPVCAPSRSTLITGRYASGLGTGHMRSRRALPDGVKFFPAFLRAAGYFTSNNAKTDYNTSTDFSVAWDRNGAKAHWRDRAGGQPFFSVFNFHESHESSLHKRRELVTDPKAVRVPAYLPDTPESRADLAQYYDNVALADASIDGLLAQLEEDGLVEDTIIFYYGDHGGAVSRSKRFLYESGTRVPLVILFPKKFQHLAPAAPGSRLSEPVGLVDLPPTVLSLAGVPLPDQFQGRALAGAARAPAPGFAFMFRDRMDERYDMARAVTDGRYRYIRNYYTDRPWGQRLDYLWRQASMAEWHRLFLQGSLNASQRLFFEPKPAEELFDSEMDPDNVRNLAGDPAHKARLEKFRAALRGHLLAIRDTGFMPEPMMVERAAAESPVVLATDPEVYPLEKILDLIDGQQLAPAADPAALRQAAAAQEPTVRYWGAVLALQRDVPVDLAPLLKDPDASVRLAAAEAILRREDSAEAWAVIGAALAEGVQSETQLFAVNVISRIPRKFPADFVPVLEKFAASSSPGSYVGIASRELLEDAGIVAAGAVAGEN